jgi:hypothetical protein
MDTTQMLKQYHNHTQTLSDGSKLIHREGNIYDVFIGRGWSTHYLFRVFKNRVLGGLTKNTMASIDGREIPIRIQKLILTEIQV